MNVPAALAELGLPGPGGFLGATTPYPLARRVMLGIPMDHTTSFRPGTREGPRRIREVSEVLESYSPRWGVDLEACALADLGDLPLPWGDAGRCLEMAEAAVSAVLEDGRCPVVLGGEHLLTLAGVRAAARRFPSLCVVQLDAHLDLRDTYLGLRLSHATVMRRVSEIVGIERVVALGVRSGTREEWQLFGHTLWPQGGDLLAGVEAIRRLLRGRPFYLTVDIDVADPACAPGTGTPEPGGPSASEVLEAVGRLASLGPVAMDLVEVCPARDLADLSSILGAKLVREAVAALEAGATGERATEPGGSFRRWGDAPDER